MIFERVDVREVGAQRELWILEELIEAITHDVKLAVLLLLKPQKS